MPTLQAYCDGCSATSVVPPEELLDFEVRCAACGEGTLVIRWSGPPPAPPPRQSGSLARGHVPLAAPSSSGAFARTAPPPPPRLSTGALGGKVKQPTGALGGLVSAPAPPRPAAGPPLPGEDEEDTSAAPEPPPARATLPEPLPGEDDPLDPFEAAAQKLDRSVTVAMRRARRHAAAALDRPTSAALERPTAGLGSSIEQRPTRAMPPMPPGRGAGELEGVAAEAPPLPAWDGGDTSRVIHLAQSDPTPLAADPVSLEVPAARTPAGEASQRALEGAVEVVQVDGTRGTGSRTYDRAEAAALAGATLGGAAPSGAELGGGTPAPAGLRIEDSDWLALIDELTEEQESHDGPSRVFIRLPEDAAPTDATNQEQVARFQATMRRLEEGGVGPLGSVARAEPHTPSAAQPRGLQDPETRPWEDTGKSPPRGAEDPDTRPWEDTGKSPPRGAEDPDTRPWESKAKSGDDTTYDAPALDGAGHSTQPPTVRAEPVTPESSGRMVKEFPHHDLDPALVCARDAASPRADAFRQLYQRIFHSGRDPAPRVVLITSPGPGAGKTTVASNLAIVAARIPGRGAVLVDADPRGRGVLRYFGVRRRAEGLLETLQTGEEPRNRMLQFNLGTLDVMPLGIKGSDAPELIASDRLMGDTLERLRGAYPNSVVLIDGSSALQAADPLALARLTDGAVVVVRAGHTAREDVRRTIDLLGPERVLGLVFNDA